ncbi:site-specific integrase [Herbaspirillum sp. CAH-3]|uniref:site-specific integrase n=1 Tax=Herbaspirillum sp. CAH-3 TaxID=2605746 RepID=UPI0012AD058D|nr:site-specific integrase [Herbaspirillum sp. CAH-3]MRT32312.1 site-specific integrase [Herbaspirillum sp. CAH-3]
MEQLQLPEFGGLNDRGNVLAELCSRLPSLPSTLRYYDEFNDVTRSISNPQERPNFELMINGQSIRLDFTHINSDCRIIFKHVFAFALSKDLSIQTVYTYLSGMRHLTPTDLAALIDAGPTGIGLVWRALRGRALPMSAYMTAKYMLHLLCTYRLYGWSSDYVNFISTTLPLPAQEKYRGVRSGDAFLSAEEEALVVRYLDDVTEQLRHSGAKQLLQDELADAGMLVCSYQFAMRPIQIAMLDVRHVRIWNDEASKYPAVHLTFHVAKQRGSKKNVAMTRRVKSEWTPIFVHWQEHLDANGITGTAKFFQAQSSQEVGTRISTLVRSVLNSKDTGTATDLRHTAAQRLVDAGASHEELAAFLGHTQTDTGLVYFSISASHAERVNRVLNCI